MICNRCKKTGNINISGQSLCKSCFIKTTEKRVRKYLRINKIIQKDDILLITDDLSYYFIKNIFTTLPITIYKRKTLNKDFIKKHKINKILVPWTIDDENDDFLNQLFNKKQSENSKEISILKVLTDKEAELFSKSLNITFNPKKKHKNITDLINIMEKDHPNIRFALNKSYNEFKDIIADN